MVKSGLDEETFERDNSIPVRVSQYRLTAHLMTALALYSGMFWTAMVVFVSLKYLFE